VAKSKRGRQRKRRRRNGAPPVRLSAEERAFARAVTEVKRQVEEAHAPDTPPERVAALLLEAFADLPSPRGFGEMLHARQSPQRARAVAEEAQQRAPRSVTALTIAAEVARLDGERERACALLEEALEAYVDPDGMAELADHLLASGLAADALACAEETLAEDPVDEVAQDVRAGALGRLHVRATAAERLEGNERDALARFSDRTALYRVREALVEYVDRRPELQRSVAVQIAEWDAELRAADEQDGSALDDAPAVPDDGMARLALEHAWLLGPDDDEGDEPAFVDEDDDREPDSPLELFAADPDTPPELADAARAWRASCTYGLWQLVVPEPAPGVWLTDIVSGARRYAAVPPEQLEGASRWSVLLGALVALDGVWRSTGALVPLRPDEGDWAAELARSATLDLATVLVGERPRHRPPDKGPEPHGVLVEREEPADPVIADLMSKVLANLVPTIAGAVRAQRAAGPTMTNTEGHRLRLITATLSVRDPAVAVSALAAHEDFSAEEGGRLSWWGRELTRMERESALAHLREQTGEEVEEPTEPQRWLRGRLERSDGGLTVEVNSEERLALLLDLLGELGLEPQLTRRSVIDPAQDLPRIPTGGPQPFGGSQDAIDAWLAHWPDERVPALGGLSPRVAARRRKSRARLEALLREFEHDAHLLARRGAPAPDISRLRAELGMQRWWE